MAGKGRDTVGAARAEVKRDQARTKDGSPQRTQGAIADRKTRQIVTGQPSIYPDYGK